MAVFGSDSAPLTVCRAIGVFDRVEGVLHPRAELVHRHIFFMGHAAIDDEQRLGAEIFAELKVFMVAEAVGRVVLPDIVLVASFGHVADGLLPAIGQIHPVALDPASAGEAHEGGLEVA